MRRGAHARAGIAQFVLAFMRQFHPLFHIGRRRAGVHYQNVRGRGRQRYGAEVFNGVVIDLLKKYGVEHQWAGHKKQGVTIRGGARHGFNAN